MQWRFVAIGTGMIARDAELSVATMLSRCAALRLTT
jgi:hypothetical protein